ncbi:MAG: YidC/Oxa1 family membrane protein insertase [Candidatus Peribacteraceae bacterium]|nr:YidC/Oxa1 family membrane protein insertase [Candidatus Peribacteraceae bacterium]
MNKQKLLNYALIAVITILLVQAFSNKQEADPAERDDLQIVARDEITVGNAVTLTLQNNTAKPMALANDCPGEPFQVSQYLNGEWQLVTATADVSRCAEANFEIEPGAHIGVSYQPWQRDLFAEAGQYRIEIPVADKTFFKEIEISNPGFFGKIWRTIVYRPIYNLLVALTDLAGHSFGWGIVLLTLLLRALLFVPFQKSLKSQRKLQKIQPQLDEIKKRYEGNQQMIAMETMALMKKNKVSPFGSCLPILIQMPFLIALFWVTRDGLGENTFVLLYPFLSDFNLAAVTTNFFGIELLAPGAQFYFALPIFLALAQFAQMKLAMHHSKKNQPQKKPGENAMADAMQSMTKVMPYFLPIMIGFFAVSMPAGVGIYWGTSTLFGIGQQIVVNRQIK